jgi:hypothetical protein
MVAEILGMTADYKASLPAGVKRMHRDFLLWVEYWFSSQEWIVKEFL